MDSLLLPVVGERADVVCASLTAGQGPSVRRSQERNSFLLVFDNRVQTSHTAASVRRLVALGAGGTRTLHLRQVAPRAALT